MPQIPFLLMALLVIISIVFITVQIAFRYGYKKAAKDLEGRIEEIKNQALNQQRAVIKGKISEQLAPYLPDFPFQPSECRFLGSPIDFLVFEGMDKGKVETVFLVDVKTDTANLSPLQLSIEEAVNKQRVFFKTCRIKIDQ